MAFRLIQVDAFTHKVFSGNPAAVCILTDQASDLWMQNLAREMNLSETAFLERGEETYNLRWFTPTTEVKLCGHATLASAHVLWELGYLDPHQAAQFYTLSGLLHARRAGDWIELDFPSEPAGEIKEPNELAAALGTPILYVGKNRFDYLVEVESDECLRSITPNHAIIREMPARGVIVTARSSSREFDFVSRFFAPGVGIDEDPVTGSAHCCLGPYWAKRLNRLDLRAYQASERGGIVRVRVTDERVYLSGQAVTVFTGEIAGPALPCPRLSAPQLRQDQ